MKKSEVLIVLVTYLIVIYLICSFTSLEVNPLEWSERLRRTSVIALITPFALFFSVVVWKAINDFMKK